MSDRSPKTGQRLFRRWSDLEKYVGVVSLAIGGAILVSYWQILLVTAIGMGVMFLTYNWQDDRWQNYLANWQTWFQGANGKLAIAVASGSIASILVYVALSICTAAENLWLGLATVLETLGTIAIAPLLLWQFIRKDKQHHQANYQRSLGHLTAPEALDRLIAVNQILSQDREQSLTSQQQREVAEYFELMLDREDSSQVRAALLTGLNQLGGGLQQLDCHPTLALSLPVNLSQPIWQSQSSESPEEDLSIESWSQD